MKLLYYSPASYGGLADYAHEQANALVDLGVEVFFLCTPGFPTGRQKKYKIVPNLQELKTQNPHINKIFKAIAYTNITLSNVRKLAQFVEDHNFQYVLLGSYAEYLAPLWSGSLRRLAQQGVIFGAVVHDPVRDFVVGPFWWHRWSIACGYSFLREAFVHESIRLDTVRPMPKLRTTVIPHGSYHFAEPDESRSTTRAALGLPVDAKVMLSFGHIRDNKNLHLILRAMARYPELYLIVAGKEQSSGQKPATEYQQLARELDVANRCRWLIQFIPNQDAANLFNTADLVLLTYNQHFHSASGVLNAAISYRKLCLASGGEGSLKTCIRNYQLGFWVEPDSLEALVEGIQAFLVKPPQPEWARFLIENSWQRNSSIVHTAMSHIG